MIVGENFRGDIHDRVKWLQHDVYPYKLSVLFNIARQKYLHAEQMLNTKTELGSLIPKITSFDHRTLQDAHDIIAGYFRFKFREELDPKIQFEGEPDDDTRILNLWNDFFNKEVDALTNSGEFSRAVLKSAAYNNKQGLQAEEFLRLFLMERFEDMIFSEKVTTETDKPINKFNAIPC
jgi:hypothetical protein